MLACSNSVVFNLIGTLSSLASCLVFVLQNIFSKRLLIKNDKRGDGLDKTNLLFYTGLFAFILMTPLWCYYDGNSILFDHHLPNPYTLWLFFLNGTTHFFQNVFAFSILALVSPVTYSIASLIKRIFVIVASILWFADFVGIRQGIGIILTGIGLWMYQSTKREVAQGEVKLISGGKGVLPVSNRDLNGH